MTTLTSQDLEALKALAERATPTEWYHGSRGIDGVFRHPDMVYSKDATGSAVAKTSFSLVHRSEEDVYANAAFIAAFNPQTALALIAHITALEAEKAEARAMLEEAGQIMGSMVDDHNDPQWADIVNACEGIRVSLALKERT